MSVRSTERRKSSVAGRGFPRKREHVITRTAHPERSTMMERNSVYRDELLPVLAVATEGLRRRHFEPARGLAGLSRQDPIDRLGRALGALAASLEHDDRQLAQFDALMASMNRGVLLEDILDGVYEGFRDVIPYERIGLALLAEGGRTVVARWAKSAFPVARLLKGFHAPLAGSSLATVLENRRPRIINDLPAYLVEHPDSDSTRLVVEEGVRSSLTCPLVADDVPIGFLFFSSARIGAYSDEHVEIFSRIAGQLSLLVEKGRMVTELSASRRELERQTRFIREIFGRYTSEDVVSSLLETPEGLHLGGRRKRVSILMADLRGFTSLSESLAPEEVVSMLNDYLGTMAAIVIANGGTIDEFIGDGILVVFGAPRDQPDHARRAVACALEMQTAMPAVNVRNRARGLPEVEMGIGINTGEVVVGNIGSNQRAKYSLVGSHVNLASRIEGYTVGGQILASEATCREAGEGLELAGEIEVDPKGVAAPITLFDVVGLDDCRLEREFVPLVKLEVPMSVSYAILEGKDVGAERHAGVIEWLSATEARMRPSRGVRPLSNIRIEVGTFGGPKVSDVYAKVLVSSAEALQIRFTSVPPEVKAFLKARCEPASAGVVSPCIL